MSQRRPGPCLLLLALALPACDEGAGACRIDPVVAGDDVPGLCLMAPDGCGGGSWATVQAVFDGDTLTLSDGTKVRLLGINAPEQPDAGAGRGEGDPATCFGPDAGDFLRDWILGRQVCLKGSPAGGAASDAYGRLLKYVFADGVNVNTMLVATGHACVYDAFAEEHCNAALLTQEARAAQLGLGLWGLCADLHGDPCARND